MGETENQQLNKINVKDKYHLIRFLFYFLGVSWQISSNFLLTANEYWMYKFRDVNSNSTNTNEKTTLQTQFTSTFTIINHVCLFLFLAVGVFVAQKLSFKIRIYGTLLVNILMFVMTMVFVGINTDSWQVEFFILTMGLAAIISAITAVYMITFLIMAAKFPPLYLAYAVSGQSICGIFAALTQIFALSLGTSPKGTALIYFSVAISFMFLTLIFYFVASSNSKFFVYYIELDTQVVHKKPSLENIKQSLFKLRYFIVALGFTAGCTIMIHPAVTSLIVSSNKGYGDPWADKFFIPVITFLCFNVFELIGREMAAIIKKPRNVMMILVTAVIRLSFIPLFMFCNLQPRSYLPVAFKNDTFYVIFMMIFAFTGGYFLNLAIIHKDKVMTKEEEAINALLIMVVLMTIIAGSSFLSVAIIGAL